MSPTPTYLIIIIILNLTRSAAPPPAMEASASAYASAPARLLPLLASPPRFLHLSLRRPSARRHGYASGGGGGGCLLVEPPPLGPGSRARCRTTCCASSPEQANVLLGVASLDCLLAVTLLTALQLMWLRWHIARHGDFPEVRFRACSRASPDIS